MGKVSPLLIGNIHPLYVSLALFCVCPEPSRLQAHEGVLSCILCVQREDFP